MNLQTLSTAELYLETVKSTTPDVPLCCSSQKFGSSGHKGAASRTCTAAGEASKRAVVPLAAAGLTVACFAVSCQPNL